MNALKNCSDSCQPGNLFALGKRYLLALLLLIASVSCNAADQLTAATNGIDMSDYFKVLLGLIFVIALFLVSTFLFKRYGSGPMTGRGQLRVVDGLHLGNRERLVLVEFKKGKQVLLAITPGRIEKLDTVDGLSSSETSFDTALADVQAATD